MDVREIWIRLNAISRLPTNKAIQIAKYLQSVTQLTYRQLKVVACQNSKVINF